MKHTSKLLHNKPLILALRINDLQINDCKLPKSEQFERPTAFATDVDARALRDSKTIEQAEG